MLGRSRCRSSNVYGRLRFGCALLTLTFEIRLCSDNGVSNAEIPPQNTRGVGAGTVAKIHSFHADFSHICAKMLQRFDAD